MKREQPSHSQKWPIGGPESIGYSFMHDSG